MSLKEVMEDLISLSRKFEGVEHEVESDSAIYFYSVPRYKTERSFSGGSYTLKYSAIYSLHSRLKEIEGLIVDILEAEDNPDGEERDLLYVQIEVI